VFLIFFIQVNLTHLFRRQVVHSYLPSDVKTTKNIINTIYSDVNFYNLTTSIVAFYILIFLQSLYFLISFSIFSYCSY